VYNDIHYKRSFNKGVNLWVGDNLVGKSSIFKIIKLALTGRNSIAKDVGSWLTKVWLEFSLGSNIYTTCISRDGNKNFRFKLINSDRSNINENQEATITLYEGGLGNFETFMQSFFFRELGYYSLQWTQHSSQEDNPKLLTSNASWATYYKSVYLEAEDYNVLFWGQQSELIFQMLLGLELTFPINRLKVKREHLLNQLGISQMAEGASIQTDVNEIQEIEHETEQIDASLEELKNKAQLANSHNDNTILQKVEDSRLQYRNAINRRIELEDQLDKLNQDIIALKRKLANLSHQLDDYEIEIAKKERSINDLRDYLEIGAFFNSLEVRTCPNCNKEVEKQKVELEKSTGSCRLCNHELEHQDVEAESFEYQINQLQEQHQQLLSDLRKIKSEWDNTKYNYEQVTIKIDKTAQAINSLPIKTLQENIAKLLHDDTNKPEPFNIEAYSAKITELASQKAILQQKLIAIAPRPVMSDTQNKLIHDQIKALELAEEELKHYRNELSKDPINKLEKLYLKQLHEFGLPHYERVEIKPNFKVSYFMHNNEFSFDEISAGEKLRAKLGLYIALIEMDVEYQLGHHPRFIVLDSPAREEGDHSYVEGLSTTLTYTETLQRRPSGICRNSPTRFSEFNRS